MKLFLTSNIGGIHEEKGTEVPCALDASNHFTELLQKYWKANSKCLIISSSPENEEINDKFKALYEAAFKISGFSLSQIDVCDKRNENKFADMLYDYDVLILAGGHVPTENNFFARLHLKELIKSYDGIVIGISAGSMNSSDVVYAQPELDSEAVDPEYKRYLKGLNLTNISILPHFQHVKDLSIGGLRVLEDISLPDSKVRPFYALVDGSYIFVENNKTTLYGEAYFLKDGTIEKVCEKDKKMLLD